MFSNSASPCITSARIATCSWRPNLLPISQGRSFAIESIATMNKKELKQLLAGLTHANIAVRNFPLTVAQLRKKLKLKDGGSTYLFATTDAQRPSPSTAH